MARCGANYRDGIGGILNAVFQDLDPREIFRPGGCQREPWKQLPLRGEGIASGLQSSLSSRFPLLRHLVENPCDTGARGAAYNNCDFARAGLFGGHSVDDRLLPVQAFQTTHNLQLSVMMARP